MIDKKTSNATNEQVRCETRVDQCGQSSFEVWLPSDALREFEAWFEADLASLEQRFASFITNSSEKSRSKRDR